MVQRSEELVDRFLDAIWMERGLSKNTLGAYRADLMTLGRGLSENDKSIEQADKADLLDFIAKKCHSIGNIFLISWDNFEQIAADAKMGSR